MIKKSFLFLVSALFFTTVSAYTVEIDVPEVTFNVKNGFTVPNIEGFELDGTGEETVLPFKKMVFGSAVTKVEIVKKHEITLEAPLKKGGALYRLSDMHKIDPSAFGRREMPSLSKFTFDRKPSFKRDKQIFSFDFYPVIPISGNKAVKIDRIRVTTKEKSLLPMANTKSGNSLLILTTEYFLAGSEQIENYIAAKKDDGFNVSVATEKDYEGGNLKGVKRVEKIREYLKSVYRNYDFLLIIAGTAPNGDEVPMLVTKPCVTGEPDYDDVPTDIFYAELSEDIDSNGNGIYGEYDDLNEGFEFELIVGRIPIYGKNVRNADNILARTIDFIKEKPSKAEYRRKILFPATISYYARQDVQDYIPKMDGAYIAEYLMKNSIKDYFSTKLLVEKEGIDPSEFTDEEALTYDSMLANINQGFGTVFWQAHGLPDCSARTIWYNDQNGNGIPETYNYELYSDDFVDNNLANEITAVNPFIFQASCLNGSIQSEGSLAYNMLRKTAVGVVGASQVSYGLIFSDYDLSSQDIFAYGTVFTDALVNNKVPAEVLFETKTRWSYRDVLLTVKYEINYLGDPSLKLNIQTCSTDSDCDDSIFCNGREICVEGFCEKESGSMPCLESAECEESICDESKKSCKTSPLPDGSFCGMPENACAGGRECRSGKCTDIDLKDCSEFDSDCSVGSCDPENGECISAPANEGGPCTTAEGKEGFCGSSGECTPKKSSSSGCSVVIF